MQHALAHQRVFGVPTASRRAVRPARSGNGATAALAEGARIKVTAPIKIWHVAKFKQGLDLNGMEGTVVQPNVCDYKHHDGKQHNLSANLPIKVQFMVPAPDGGKDIKVLAHLADDEIEVV